MADEDANMKTMEKQLQIKTSRLLVYCSEQYNNKANTSDVVKITSANVAKYVRYSADKLRQSLTING